MYLCFGLLKTQTTTTKADREKEEKKKTFKGKYFMLFKCVLYYILTVINFISGYLWVFCVLLLLCCRERQAKSVFFLFFFVEGGMSRKKVEKI